jgi:DNA-binding CsgD family transcriptional regulator
MKGSDLISAFEACYEVDRDCTAWLEGVHTAVSSLLDRGLGTLAYRYDLLSRRLRIYETVEQRPAVDVAAMKDALTTVPVEYIAQSYRALTCAMASEVPGYDDLDSVKRFFRPAGVEDIFAINAFDPRGVGIWVGAFHPKRWKLPPRIRVSYSRLSAHISAGFRLQQRIARSNVATDAVLTPRGRVVHAERDAKVDEARVALSDAARSIERARGKLRRKDPENAATGWRALVAAKWSLVDHFERDGKRYIVAKANAARLPGVEGLAPRETQVVAYASLGHHNKLIAYELGLAASTVRVLLTRAARKLGTTTRAETITKFLAARDRAAR